MTREKGKSPFSPGKPVPPELFVGRAAEINKILVRGSAQVAAGKSVSIFVQGEYGIGKSSIANYVQRAAESKHGLLRVYTNLGGAQDLKDMSIRILEAVVRAGSGNSRASEKVAAWLSKYVGKQSLFGVTINFEALRRDAPSLETPGQMLGFFRETLARVGTPIKGIFLALDELNGIVNNAQFSHFIKGLVEENAMSTEPLPLLLMLCGVEERRRTMIKHHPPIDRIFDIIEIEKMDQAEMEEFFTRSFAEADMTVDRQAMKTLTMYSAGLPKVMHVIGDEAYFRDTDGKISQADAFSAVVSAADEIGRKFVGQQVYKALRSPDYHSILAKIGGHGSMADASFTKRHIAEGLTEGEKKKLGNFLQRMKKLNVIRNGDSAGEYVFNVQMVRVYIWLHAVMESANKEEEVTDVAGENTKDFPTS